MPLMTKVTRGCCNDLQQGGMINIYNAPNLMPIYIKKIHIVPF